MHVPYVIMCLLHIHNNIFNIHKISRLLNYLLGTLHMYDASYTCMCIYAYMYMYYIIYMLQYSCTPDWVIFFFFFLVVHQPRHPTHGKYAQYQPVAARQEVYNQVSIQPPIVTTERFVP